MIQKQRRCPVRKIHPSIHEAAWAFPSSLLGKGSDGQTYYYSIRVIDPWKVEIKNYFRFLFSLYVAMSATSEHTEGAQVSATQQRNTAKCAGPSPPISTFVKHII